jgi:hypothetical protein
MAGEAPVAPLAFIELYARVADLLKKTKDYSYRDLWMKVLKDLRGREPMRLSLSSSMWSQIREVIESAGSFIVRRPHNGG